MVDIPEYERKTGVTPAASPSGFQGAVSGFIQAEHQISTINSQLAQNLANDEAQKQGIEAAQNPQFGQFTQMNPALSQTDKVFKDAYRQESAQVLNFQGRKLLDNLYNTVAQDPNPNSKTLAAFQNNAQEGMQKILANADPSTLPQLKRSLESSYITQNTNLIKRVEDSGRKFRANQLEAQSAQTQKEATDASLNGNFKRAGELLQERFAQIDRQAVTENWPAELTSLTKRNAVVQNEANNESFRAKNAINAGRSEEYLSNLRKNPPKDFSPTEQDQIIKHVNQYSNQYESSLKGQQYIEYTNAMSKLDSGALTQADVNNLRGKIGGEYFAKLSNRMLDMTRKIDEQNRQSIDMRKDYDSPQRMERWSPSERDAAYERDVQIAEQSQGIKPGQLPLNQRVNIASEMQAPNGPLTKQLSAGIRYGDVSSANAALRLNAVNEVSLSGMDKKSRDVLSLYEQDKLAHIPDDIALKNATGKVFSMDEKAMDENESRFGSILKDKNLNADINMQRAFVADVMKTGNVPIPAGFSTRFMEDFKQNFRRTDNWDAALKQSTDKFNRSYGITYVNGKPEFTQYPIEKYILNGQSALDVIRTQGVTQIQDLNSVLKSQFDSNNGNYYFEFPEKDVVGPIENISNRIESEYASGNIMENSIPIIKITKDYDGKITKEKGFVSIQADKYSTTLVNSGVPSYFMGFKVEGKPIQPIIDPRQNWIGGSVRFSPNTREYTMEALQRDRADKEKAVEQFYFQQTKSDKIPINAEDAAMERLLSGEL